MLLKTKYSIYYSAFAERFLGALVSALVLAAAFPTLSNGKGLWWILYTIVGLFVPIVINLIKKSMLNKKHNLGRE